MDAADYSELLNCPVPCICSLCNVASTLLHAALGNAEIFEIATVKKDKDSTMEEIAQAEGTKTCFMRIFGWVVMFVAVIMIANPLVSLLSYIPFVGKFMAAVLGISIFCVGFLVTGLASMTVIAVAYIVFRPALSILLFTAIGAVFVLGSSLTSSRGPTAIEVAKKLL